MLASHTTTDKKQKLLGALNRMNDYLINLEKANGHENADYVLRCRNWLASLDALIYGKSPENPETSTAHQIKRKGFFSTNTYLEHHAEVRDLIAAMSPNDIQDTVTRFVLQPSTTPPGLNTESLKAKIRAASQHSSPTKPFPEPTAPPAPPAPTAPPAAQERPRKPDHNMKPLEVTTPELPTSTLPFARKHTSSETIQTLVIKTLSGSTFMVECGPRDTIADLKLKIQTMTGINQEHSTLIFCSSALEDNNALTSEYRFHEHACVHLVVRNNNTSKIATLRNDTESQIVWELLYLNGNDDPFNSTPATIMASESLEEVMAAYKSRLDSRHSDQIPYIAATVVPRNWSKQFANLGTTAKTGNLISFMSTTAEHITRPVLGIYGLAEGQDQRFVSIRNPQFIREPRGALAETQFTSHVEASKAGHSAEAVALTSAASSPHLNIKGLNIYIKDLVTSQVVEDGCDPQKIIALLEFFKTHADDLDLSKTTIREHACTLPSDVRDLYIGIMGIMISDTTPVNFGLNNQEEVKAATKVIAEQQIAELTALITPREPQEAVAVAAQPEPARGGAGGPEIEVEPETDGQALQRFAKMGTIEQLAQDRLNSVYAADVKRVVENFFGKPDETATYWSTAKAEDRILLLEVLMQAEKSSGKPAPLPHPSAAAHAFYSPVAGAPLPKGLLIDFGGVLEGRISETLTSGGEFNSTTEIQTTEYNVISRKTIEGLITLRQNGVKLYSMSSDSFADQAERVRCIQKAYPAFKFDVLLSPNDERIPPALSNGVCESTKSYETSGNGKDEIRQLYMRSRLIPIGKERLYTVMDDGQPIITKAKNEGFDTLSFSGAPDPSTIFETYLKPLLLGLRSEHGAAAASSGPIRK